MKAGRPTIDVSAAPGGWPTPWLNVAELADALPAGSWTLVGGLMTQLHTIDHGLGIVRPTNDVDIVLHIETQRGIPTRSLPHSKGLATGSSPASTNAATPHIGLCAAPRQSMWSPAPAMRTRSTC